MRAYKIVGALSDGHTLLEQLGTLRPQLLILDISMPGVEGIELVSAVKQYYPDTRILIYSVHDSWQKVRDCLERGADGYVVKSDLQREYSNRGAERSGRVIAFSVRVFAGPLLNTILSKRAPCLIRWTVSRH